MRNYVTVLFLVLSARWPKLLEASSDHECYLVVTPQGHESCEEPGCAVDIDIGEGLCKEDCWPKSSKGLGVI